MEHRGHDHEVVVALFFTRLERLIQMRGCIDPMLVTPTTAQTNHAFEDIVVGAAPQKAPERIRNQARGPVHSDQVDSD
ncbi:hypothetical protein VTO73DRAFT_1831 [Trametes versicolor]